MEDPGPLKILLETFGLESFQGLAATDTSAPTRPGQCRARSRCRASSAPAIPTPPCGLFRAPVSYRASHGRRLPGPHRRVRSLPAHQPGRGRAGRRLELHRRFLGAVRGRQPSPTTPRPPTSRSRPGRCPRGDARAAWLTEVGARWHGDAGSSWARGRLPVDALQPRAATRRARLVRGRRRTGRLHGCLERPCPGREPAHAGRLRQAGRAHDRPRWSGRSSPPFAIPIQTRATHEERRVVCDFLC